MWRSTDFAEIWAADMEFRQPPGERPDPLCLVARELRSGRLVRLWQHQLRRCRQAPFDVGPRALFVAYLATAELSCFLQLGWRLPVNILDMYAEFRLDTAGRPVPCGYGLLGAQAFFGLSTGVDSLAKAEMRQLAQRGGSYTQ
jgi:hypothetical protein